MKKYLTFNEKLKLAWMEMLVCGSKSFQFIEFDFFNMVTFLITTKQFEVKNFKPRRLGKKLLFKIECEIVGLHLDSVRTWQVNGLLDIHTHLGFLPGDIEFDYISTMIKELEIKD